MQRHIPLQWIAPPVIAIPQEIRNQITGSELFLRALIRQGIKDAQTAKGFLDPDQYQAAPGSDFPGMENAVERILSAIKNHETIGVWGDFDVDGQTSTAVFVSALRSLNCKVVYHIPIRKIESHGITLPALINFLKQGIDLLVTCDTGISANEAIEYCQNKCVDVIVTDHHTLPENLPPALALINPEFLPQEHHLSNLSGVGVAYKVMECVFQKLGRQEKAEELLDLVAIGLIADLALLRNDCRFLVQKGLRQIQNSPRLCLQTIFDQNNIQPSAVNESVISYVIAPRLNAVGRLGDANSMVEFLLTSDPVFASTTSNRLEGLNTTRKILCDQVFQGALSQIEQNPQVLENSVLVLSHPEWPAGIIGIVASRLVELYRRPVILFSGTDGILFHGSARSVDGINITQAIRENQSLVNSFGGHPMAAGLSIKTEIFEQFRNRLSQTVEKMHNNVNILPSIFIDAAIDNPSTIDLTLLAELSALAPFGPGNPPILYSSKNLEIKSINTLGKKSTEHLKLTLQTSNGETFSVVWWQGANQPKPGNRFELAYSANLSTFKGKPQVQFEWKDFHDSENAPEEKKKQCASTIPENFDLRQSLFPEQDLAEITGDICIYSEGITSCPQPVFSREEAHPAKTLVIWTIPASSRVLESIKRKAKPAKIFWFGQIPPENDFKFLLQRSGSLIKKYSLVNDKAQINIRDFAIDCSTTEQMATAILNWYAARGDIKADWILPNLVEISFPGNPVSQKELDYCQHALLRLQKEIMAFRSFYLSTERIIDLLPDEGKSTNQ